MLLRYKFFIGISGFLSLNFLCRSITGDFDEGELLPLHHYCLSSPISSHITSILQQPFTYMGKGHQAFVFASQDGEYILKLLKPHYPPINLWGWKINYSHLPFGKWLSRKIAPDMFAQRIQKDQKSYENAFLHFQQESLVEYVHLSPTQNIPGHLHLFDKIHILHVMNPNTTCFLLQKRVVPLSEKLKWCLSHNKLDTAKHLIDELRTLLIQRISMGWYRPTHKFHANFGEWKGKLYQLDVGNLITYAEMHAIQDPKQDIAYSLQQLQNWLLKRFPSLHAEVELDP